MRLNLANNSWVEQSTLPESLLKDEDFEALWEKHPDAFGKVNMMGRVIDTPRWQQSYLRAYNYTGMMHDPLPLPEEFQCALDWANALYPREWTFNQVLINWYENGLHYIGSHSDDTRQLVPHSPIVSISLGAERRFRIREKATKSVVADLKMTNRSYVVMGGEMQNHYTHEVPKINGEKGKTVGRRINITFRVFKD
jgi:alkylated DNA repair dioxygenase AlkB